MDGSEWLTGYRDRLDELGARARRAQEALEEAPVTATSPDGAVTVTVDPAGALRGLEFGEPAEAMGRARLAATVLDTVRRARAEAARNALAAVAPLVGSNGAAMRMLRAQLAEDLR